MEYSEQKIFLKRIRTAAAVFLCGLLLMLACDFFFAPKYEGLKESISQTSVLAKRISAVRQEADNYQTVLNESGKQYASLATEKDSYIAYLGNLTQENTLNINKMTVADIVTTGSKLFSMKVEIELQGELYNVKNLVQQLYDSEMVSRINSFSYRLQSEQELQWMWRDIDDETLVSWWDVTGLEGTKTEPEEEEKGPLKADDLMAHGTALCFFEVEFLGTGG